MFSANQKALVICTRVTSLHSCYTFCTRVTEELHSFLSQSELSNFFVYIIIVFSYKSARNVLRSPEEEKSSYSVHSQEVCSPSFHMSSFSELSPVVMEISCVKRGEFELLLLVSSSWDET